MMRRITIGLSIVPLVLLLGSYLGAYYPLGDSLAVFRGPLATLTGLSALLLGRSGAKMLAGLVGALVLWSAYTVLGPRLENAKTLDAPYTHYQKNMLYKMPTFTGLRDDILKQAPDFITLQEVSNRNKPILADLQSQFPSQLFCPFAAVGGVAVASRWPLIKNSARCFAQSGMAAIEVDTPDGRVWLVSLHLHWPYPEGQAEQVRKLVPMLKALDGPVVLGGDFNMVPWSHTMRTITTATNTRRIGVPQYTLPLKNLYTLPIDHVLVNANTHPASTSKRPLLGSDHFGVLARFYIK